MNKEALKKALIKGIPTGIFGWIFFGLFNLVLNKQPFTEAMFSTETLAFGGALIILDIIVYYFSIRKSQKEAVSN